MRLASWIATLLLVAGPALAEQAAPIVAVFDLQDHSGQLSAQLLQQLKAYLRSKLAEGGAYQVVPEGELRSRLRQQKKESYKDCYDEKCQIELGRELAAQKSLSTQIAKVGSQCMVMSALYDLRRSTSERSASHKTECTQDQLVAAIERIAAALTPKVSRPATEKTGGLSISSEPSAEVWLDGKRRGRTPLTLINIAAGKHSLKLASQFHHYEGTVVVEADKMTTREIKLSLNAAGHARVRAKQEAEQQQRRQRAQERELIAARRRSGSTWGYLLLGGGLAALATAGILYGAGIAKFNDGEAQYQDAYLRSDIEQGRDKLELAKSMVYTAHGFVVGGTILVGVAIKVLVGRPEVPADGDKRDRAWLTATSCGPIPGGAGCSVGGRF